MPDVSADVLAERRVVPEYVVTLPVFSFVRCGGFVLKGVVISAFVESFLVWRGGLVEGRFAGRQGRKSFVNAGGNVFCSDRRMVTFAVNV